jgi:hypothetical protein
VAEAPDQDADLLFLEIQERLVLSVGVTDHLPQRGEHRLIYSSEPIFFGQLIKNVDLTLDSQGSRLFLIEGLNHMLDEILDLCLFNALVRGIRVELRVKCLKPLNARKDLSFNLIVLNVITVPIMHTLEAHTASSLFEGGHFSLDGLLGVVLRPISLALSSNCPTISCRETAQLALQEPHGSDVAPSLLQK